MSSIARCSLAALIVLALPASASAERDTTPPLPGGAKCTYEVPGKIRVGKALRGGVPVKVSCTGAAKGGAGATLRGRKIENYIARRYSGGHPGDALVALPQDLPAGKTTVRMKVRPWARGFFRRFARYGPFSIHTHFATKRTDGEYWAFSNRPTKIVR